MIKIKQPSYPINKNLPTYTNSLPSDVAAHIQYYIFQIRAKYPNISNPDILFSKLNREYLQPNYNLTPFLLSYSRDCLYSYQI